MTPPDARVLIVATLIIAGVPVAVHEYRIHARRHLEVRHNAEDHRAGWSAASSGGQGERAERSSEPTERPAR